MVIKIQSSNCLEYDEKKYVLIPEDFISATIEMNNNCLYLGLLVFLLFKCGNDGFVTMSIEYAITWLELNPQKFNGINQRLLDNLILLKQKGYINFDEEMVANLNWNWVTFFEVEVFKDNIINKSNRQCKLVPLYYDELQKIMKCNLRECLGKTSNDRLNINNLRLLWIFLYIRLKTNLLRGNKPEAYSEKNLILYDKLRVNRYVCEEALRILCNLKLIYRERYDDTCDIYCNYYKRSNGNLLAYGEEYYSKEIKKEIIRLEKDGDFWVW